MVDSKFEAPAARTTDPTLPQRGSGRTTQQMRDAPRGACFVWCNERLDYPTRLAKALLRSDLTIIAPSQDLDDFHRARVWAVVRDHACTH